ncbi:hypothetical protein [Streptomyces lunaelactis]|uniref:hypothetical protein n=1 Tax=Streptomyces lunaelactis TaxID=1535768 RepID=UPI0015847238|nr:hypothetical protein [Streptomyces lunaelactis]NUK06386.1 hypothetical protein [Streptomyces lunaelactis]NUK21043.1 hypothetical protein [Streptomyces lunaelactis]
MSRTVHHIPLQHRATSWWSNYLGPWTAHAVIELRYSHAESGESHRAGRRPMPRRIVRGFASYEYPRAVGVPVSGRAYREATARAALREFCTSAVKDLCAADDLLETAEDLDHPPTRHRHGCIWDG